MKSELKTCPFCGEKPIHEDGEFEGGQIKHYYECQNVYCMIQPSMPSQDSEEEAIKWWNTRKP